MLWELKQKIRKMTARLRPAKRLSLPLYVDFEQALQGASLISVCIGPDTHLYALARQGSADDKQVGAGGAIFPKIRPDSPKDFIVLVYDGSQFKNIAIPRQTLNYHFAQPLPNEELLLVCARSQHRGTNDHDLNGRVFDSEGHQIREFLLGDGIADVQTTADGRIWTSYFDEGVFGNFGWDEPVGSNGLRCWSSEGELVYEYEPEAEDEDSFIADCYALNVSSDEHTWIYFSTEFPLVRITGQYSRSTWRPSVDGSNAVAVWQDWALFQGGYNDHDTFELYKLDADGRCSRVALFRFSDERSRKTLDGTRATGRGCLMHLIEGTRVYRINLAGLVGSLQK